MHIGRIRIIKTGMDRKTRSKKLFFFILLLTVILSIFNGCGRKREKDQIELTLMHGWGGTLEEYRVMEKIYEEFEEQNPYIKMTYIAYANSEITVKEANDLLAIGKVPDIVSTNGLSYYVNNLAASGKALDLMPYIEADPEWKAVIPEQVFRVWQTPEGELYTLPDVLEAAGYWYNEDLLVKAGVITYGEQLPTKWKELLDKMGQLNQWLLEYEPEKHVCMLDDEQMLEFLFYARMAGECDEMTILNKEASISEAILQPVLEDLGFLRRISDYTNNIENVRRDVQDGSCAFYFNGVWESPVVSKSSANWKYANYPGKDGKSLSYMSPSSGYVLGKQQDEKKAEAAVRFLKYMLSEEVQNKIAQETGQVPLNQKIVYQEHESGDILFWNAMSTTMDAQLQIPTIRCVWNEFQIDVVSELLQREDLSLENAGVWAEKINRARENSHE